MGANRVLLMLALTAALCGCVRSIADVAALPVTDTATTPKSIQEVRDCLVAVMNEVRTRPVETGAPERREVAFEGDNGTIALYILTETEDGTKVEARRRQMIMDNYGKARTCYIPAEDTAWLGGKARGVSMG